MIPVSGRRASAVTAALSTVVVAALSLLAALPAQGVETAAPATSSSGPFRPARPYWLELTPPQREALAPLTADWEHLDSQTKKKWVEIANRYPRMQPEERVRTQERMREWAMLTPEQRRVARDSFERIRAMPPEQRAAMLRRYQELPPEKRAALAHQGVAGRALVVPKAPAVTAASALPRRLQIKEGATVRNPVVAAQKSASPVVTPAQPVAPNAAPVPAPAAIAPVPAPAVVQPGS